MRLDYVITFPLSVLAKVEDVPLHFPRQGLELVSEAGENLPLSCYEVGDVPVRAEIADDDDGVVGEDEFLQTFVVAAVDDIGKHGLAITAEGVLDDVGADESVAGVVESGLVHSRFLCSIQR